MTEWGATAPPWETRERLKTLSRCYPGEFNIPVYLEDDEDSPDPTKKRKRLGLDVVAAEKWQYRKRVILARIMRQQVISPDDSAVFTNRLLEELADFMKDRKPSIEEAVEDES